MTKLPSFCGNKVWISWQLVVKSLARDVGLDSYTLKYVNHRMNNEGITFLTKTLPKLSKSVLKSLELGYFDRPTCFSWKGASLRYFTVWLDKIFDQSGNVRPDACAHAIKHLRQFCEYFYKLSLPFSNKVEIKFERKVKDIERNNSVLCQDNLFLETMRKIFCNIFPELTRSTVVDMFQQHRPRFTSGAFAGSENKNYSYYVYKTLSDKHIGTCNRKQMPFSGFFKPYPSSGTPIMPIDEDGISHTLFVPKDSRGPRCISKEPLHLLRGQMAYFDYMKNYLESKTRNRINFSDQSINQRLAHLGSVDKSLATLDLKDASDSVRLSVVNKVFRNSPLMRYCFNNFRSTHTRLPVSRDIIPLRKLSGMGSGLTFPTMALLIYLSVITSVHMRTNLALSKIKGSVYVYGDDVIIPSAWYNFAQYGLQAAGLCCNNEKSYYRSNFRESCGADFFKGVRVSPSRLKLSGNRINSARVSKYKYGLPLVGETALFQLDRHCRELVKNGLVTVAEYFYDKLSSLFGKYYADVSGDSPFMGRWSEHAWNKDSPELRVIAKPVIENNSRNCPYKYLSRFFKYEGDDSWSGSYGKLSQPRKIKLKIENAYGTQLR